MNWRVAILMVSLLACAEPWLVSAITRPQVEDRRESFAGWPPGLLPADAQSLPLDERDVRFARNFPGKIQAFGFGSKTWILRWVIRPTREMHPASDCFRGAGYVVQPGPAWRDADGMLWSCFTATRERERWRVCERLQTQDAREKWTDVSAWFWSALWSRNRGPWIGVTRVERERFE